eukprot:Nk52_evm50s151 gene=Nk52_evmTU50s151
MITQLKYAQKTGLLGKCLGITITPYAAGHMLGGTVWKIEKETEEIVYAVDFNHRKERHLNGSVLESLERPTLLITDALNAKVEAAPRRQTDQDLVGKILTTVRDGGNVLLPVDTAGRVLELCQLFDHIWGSKAGQGLSAYPLILLNNVSYNVIEFAKSQLEWMSDNIMKFFETSRDNPFSFKHIQLCHSVAELDKFPEPKVVMASMQGLDYGFAKDVFLKWAMNSKNLMLFTNRPPPGSLSQRLLNGDSSAALIEVDVHKRIVLEGEELETFIKEKKEEIEKKREELKKKEQEEALKRKAAIMDMSDDSEDEEVGEESAAHMKVKRDVIVTTTGGSRSQGSGGFFKHARTFPMFPCLEEKVRKWDDYGEQIKAEDYIPKATDLINPGGLHAVLEGSASAAPVVPVKEDPVSKLEDELALEQDEALKNPTKSIVEKKEVDVQIKSEYLDVEGRADGRSIQVILGNIQPRQVIVIHGNDASREELVSYCKNAPELKTMVNIISPAVGECVDMTSERDIYQVKLKDSLVSSLAFSKFMYYELAYVDGIITPGIDSGIGSPELEKENPEEDKPEEEISEAVDMDVDQVEEKDEIKDADMAVVERDAVPTLDALPIADVHGHQEVFVGKLMLSDFKQILIKAGYRAEFSGGVLICNDTVAVKKDQSGSISLEGAFCEDYFDIRDLLYKQYAII